MIVTSTATSTNPNDLLDRFHEDCNLRGMVTTMDYIYRTKAYCAFLDARGKTPLNVDRDDLRAFLAQLKDKGLKFSTIEVIYT